MNPQGMYPPLFSLNNLVDVPSTRTDPQKMYHLLFSVTTTQVDVPSTCTTKDVPSNVLRQSSQAVSPSKLCEWRNKRILRREESKEFLDCVVLNSLTMEKENTKEFRQLVFRSFGKGRRETQKELRRLVLGKFFLAKGEERHKRIQAVSPSFFWKRKKRDTKRIQAVSPLIMSIISSNNEVITLFFGHLRWGPLTVIHRPERVVRQFRYIQTIPPHPVAPSISFEEMNDRWMQFSNYIAPVGQICVVSGQLHGLFYMIWHPFMSSAQSGDSPRVLSVQQYDTFVEPDVHQQPVAAATPNEADIDVHHLGHAMDAFEVIADKLERLLNLRILTKGILDVPSTRTDLQEMYALLFSVTTTQVDVPSTCTTKDVPSNVLRQSSQAVSPLKLCEGGNKRILRREESKEFSDCVVLNSLTREKGDTKEFRRLVLCSFGKGRRETQKEFRRLVLGKFFLAKGEERHKRIQTVSPLFFWKREKRDTKRIQAISPWRILFGKGRRE
ncbi:hypothetical protein HKD37_05G013290 [Glycine soja]